ncbi:TetR family transcriptional regulator [Actinoplanes sp. TRM 88003]|uniref:TetR family transcriptional regulator n=1 Tax=Paractinoplanes aksuensis TaxID=2939490 RepID=A0ABT1DFD3_9ACTN|nr:TetR family transcriptional regulator [Actinoplanes aksuensis]MCO8269538.1 TetR family transcriptional regulator [Actinoplanes aksuensis]
MDSTEERIVAAATAEFARYGIAGARIERIAKEARTSKERIYAYYRGKEALYRHVAAQELTAIAEATRLDPKNLPEYAGRVYDYFTTHPERYRLMMWGQLELAPEDPADNPLRTSMGRKIETLKQAQADGELDKTWEAVDILMFVNQIAMAWAGQSVVTPGHDEPARRRAAVVAAVRRLFPESELRRIVTGPE